MIPCSIASRTRTPFLWVALALVLITAPTGARADDRPPPDFSIPPVMIGENTALAPHALRYQRFEKGQLVGLYTTEEEAFFGSPRRTWIEIEEGRSGRSRTRTTWQVFPEKPGVVRFRIVEMRWKWKKPPAGSARDKGEGGLREIITTAGRSAANFDGSKMVWRLETNRIFNDLRHPRPIGLRHRVRTRTSGTSTRLDASWGQRAGPEPAWYIVLSTPYEQQIDYFELRDRAPSGKHPERKLLGTWTDSKGRTRYHVLRPNPPIETRPRQLRFVVVGGFDQRFPDAWHKGSYLAATTGQERVPRSQLDLVDEQCAELAKTLSASDWPLAKNQSKAIVASLAGLKAKGVACGWIRVPSERAWKRLEKLRGMLDKLDQQYYEAIEAKETVARHLYELRTRFSADVVKSMLKGALTWLDTVPTDPVAGLAGYSDLTGAVALPGTLLGWRDSAKHDAQILTKQVVAIRQAERAEAELSGFIEQTVSKRKQIIERRDKRGDAQIEAIHNRLLQAAHY